ncbi:hypothetical protein GE115_14020 [Agromyces sp. CFH 90414]|uniref:Uncharacterized protein n=1 Tax=Agromyces agglutinans TaxID=2662258 RepID=A0A6I2F9Q5_9MICO|nr:hypothetical protein [Agromyces agglutinans]MRG60974.1 hypothetical protein [Agromyces agglutinans]
MNTVLFLITMAVFVFGMWLMGNASHITGFEAIVFIAGILCIAIAMAIPINILGKGKGA